MLFDVFGIFRSSDIRCRLAFDTQCSASVAFYARLVSLRISLVRSYAPDLCGQNLGNLWMSSIRRGCWVKSTITTLTELAALHTAKIAAFSRLACTFASLLVYFDKQNNPYCLRFPFPL